MAYEYSTYEKRGRIAYVTINRPEVMNALHAPASRELWEIWNDFKDDPEVWVAILTGAGDRAFSAGLDLKYTAEQSRAPTPAATPAGQPRASFGGITSPDFECWKPIIAAVNGYALGGGLELVLACDIAIAAEHAQFGLPEPTVGITAGAGGMHKLPRQVPFKIAMGMLMTGKRISAQEAYRLGLVNEVVPLAELMPTAQRWAEEILRCAPLSVRASKQVATLSMGLPLKEAMSRTYSEQQKANQSEDRIEGPRAFAEKRPPRWTGA